MTVRRTLVVLAGAGLVACTALAIPALADDPSPDGTAQEQCVRDGAALADYLAENPAVAADLAELRGLPEEQRSTAAAEYFEANPATAVDLLGLGLDNRREARAQRQEWRAPIAEYVESDAELRAELDRIRELPVAERRAAWAEYAAANPGVAADLGRLRRDYRADRRDYRAACRDAGTGD